MSHINEIKGSSQKQLRASCQEDEQGLALTKSLSTSAAPTGVSLGQTDPTSLHLKGDELLSHSQERQPPAKPYATEATLPGAHSQPFCPRGEWSSPMFHLENPWETRKRIPGNKCGKMVAR